MPSEHSRYGASSMSRWKNCPGSVLHLERNPKGTNDYAREGTEAHDWAEQKLMAYLMGDEPVTCIDEDMDMYTEQYKDYVLGIRDAVMDRHGYAEVSVEQKFVLDHIREDAFGTNDASVFTQFEELHIIDLKYGKSKVYAKENDQLMYYALGCIQQNGLDPEKIVLHIYQPRVSNPVSTWEMTLEQLLEFEKGLIASINNVDENPEKRVPGAYCFFCNKDACPEYREEQLSKVSTQPEDTITF